MTVTTLEKGYLEAEYLEDPYATGLAEASAGMQIEFRIVDSTKEIAMQATFTIADALKVMGFQAEFNIEDKQTPYGFQSELTIKDENDIGQQALFNISDKLEALGMSVELNILDYLSENASQAALTVLSDKPIAQQGLFSLIDKFAPLGMQAEFVVLTQHPVAQEVRADKYPSLICGPGYLEYAYMEDEYLASRICHIPGMQAEFTIEDSPPIGQQSTLTIADALNTKGMQAIFQIDQETPVGMQFDSVNLGAIGQQFFATIYNSTNLRILCEYPSRGTTETNWTATSTMTGDFSVQNLDTDIVEQVWRSDTGDVTGVRVQSDTGVPQGVFLDTFAILNHNITRSATVTLLGSDDPAFGVIGTSIPIEVRENNIYYIAAALPMAGYRYWRIDIDDPTNTDGYIELGTVVFGASNIFQGECFVDEVDFQLTDFADTVRTEGFTNVSNSRALKRKVRLEFRMLNFQKNNFRIMRNLFETYRTTTKCLWIPTPSATDTTVTGRFAAFAKLTVIPSERHKYLGGDADYVSFTLEVDESL